MASTSQNIFIPGKTQDEEKAELEAKSKPIVKHGIPASIFDRDQLTNNFCFFKPFIKYVNFMSSLEEAKVLAEGIAVGVTELKLYSKPEECTFSDFVKLVKFLQSKEGQEYLCKARFRVQLIAKAEKMSRKLGKTVTPREYALWWKSEMTMQQCCAVVKAGKRKHEAVFFGPHKKLKQLEEELSRMDEECKCEHDQHSATASLNDGQ